MIGALIGTTCMVAAFAMDWLSRDKQVLTIPSLLKNGMRFVGVYLDYCKWSIE